MVSCEIWIKRTLLKPVYHQADFSLSFLISFTGEITRHRELSLRAKNSADSRKLALRFSNIALDLRTRAILTLFEKLVHVLSKLYLKPSYYCNGSYT